MVKMNENPIVVRWETVERMNGYWPTWWRYTRVTLAITLTAIAALCHLVNYNYSLLVLARQHEQLMAEASRPMLGCFIQERSTSLIFAGGSQKQIYDALHNAELFMDQVRLAYLIAHDKPADP